MKKIKRKDFRRSLEILAETVMKNVDYGALRKMWFESAKNCSVGILMFGFSPEAWDYSITLSEVLKKESKIKKRFDRWLKSKPTGYHSLLTQSEMRYMLRK